MLDDEDNLPIAFKWIKDEIGACLFPDKVVKYRGRRNVVHNKGYADSNHLIQWKYKQEKGKTYGVRIEFEGFPTPNKQEIDT